MSMESSALPASKTDQVKTHQDSHRARVMTSSKPSSWWLTQSAITYSGAAQTTESPGGPVNTDCWAHLTVSGSIGLEWSQDYAFLLIIRWSDAGPGTTQKQNHCIPNSQGLEQGTESALFINVHLPCTHLLNKQVNSLSNPCCYKSNQTSSC